jgi:hypothetical protein
MEKINLTGVSGWTDKKSCWTMKRKTGQERDVTDKNVVVQKPDNRYNIEKKVRKCRY